MANLLLELFSEEIPARMQQRAADELGRLVGEKLKASELEFESLTTDVTPRRLVLRATGLPLSQPDTKTERKGPRVGAPEKAMHGFLKSVEKSIDEVEQRETAKGTFYFAVVERQGRPASEVLAEVLSEAAASISWPKSMRWGDHDLRWVRPLHSIVCLLDSDVVPARVGHIEAGRVTQGHRFLAPEPFEVAHADEYGPAIAQRYVVLSSSERRAQIHRDALALCAAEGLTLVEDDALLSEVAGLVEYPNVLLGTIDKAFMNVPAEILTTAMRSHQKYFSLKTSDGSLAARFIVVSNMKTTDKGKQVVAGNETVLRARLADAKFFWDTDLRRTLESRVAKLDTIVFQAKFGDGADRMSHKIERIRSLAQGLSDAAGADATQADRAALLCKADLVSDVVYEFPELQGLMGRYYAEHDNESSAVAHAIADHYSPLGPGDACPSAPTSIAVALADKIDSLVGFFATDQKPTGSKDPFALRRSALGVLRLLLENDVRLSLRHVFSLSLKTYPERIAGADDVADDLLSFFADRLIVHLREQGVRHDLVRAVFSAGRDDDLVRLVRKTRALEEFLKGDDGANLLAGYRRASNIVKIEEKKDGTTYDQAPDPALLEDGPERALHDVLTQAGGSIAQALEAEDFESAMTTLAGLRQPIDTFFDDVIVNDKRAEIRANRLRILGSIRASLAAVADFGVIEG